MWRGVVRIKINIILMQRYGIRKLSRVSGSIEFSSSHLQFLCINQCLGLCFLFVFIF